MDLFAPPRHNARLPPFISSFRHPGTTVLDTLSADWNRWEINNLFPSPVLFLLCLQKLWEIACRGVFVSPVFLLYPMVARTPYTLLPSRNTTRRGTACPRSVHICTKCDVLALTHLLFSKQAFDVAFTMLLPNSYYILGIHGVPI